MSRLRILFVCLGNICRSPAMAGVFREELRQAGLLDQVEIDSAGIGAWHVGQSADERSQAACLRQGIDIAAHRARQISEEDFRSFDFIFACDCQNLQDLKRLAPHGASAKIELLLPFAGLPQSEMPDPYYGGRTGFDVMVTLCLRTSQALRRKLLPE